ncbi:hypothetical protein HETIRDRAFT_377172 [Heterobasidion irregulare TC 32-1]|uniref:non-specific serine/threonine protein kinase n=1 Tax=Heterobasidion irregulare (strain TC 32-1) TaxID=747525 RepID=W4KL73_HETIT|nr:uncharacterized protein HETIRDRAFT_377172 [Heterobasidion irregulare TC 32-1]ETW86608.1 hypothetical protein HETIRDRAFT_377172 [Heterobasidion irregulare TC 32-1]
MDAQDGPWTVSVAENPHDPASSYSLYVKTPTHNLTLSRTSREIIELNTKLHDAHPAVALPHLPIQPAPALPPKRKSAFLNTLSRLASPSSKSANGRHTARAASVTGSVGTPSGLPTPVASPGAELVDPFAAAANGLFNSPASTATNPTVTGLAAYLTTISNDQLLRQTRVWKRFVRVRTDDLESVRVERAIKRVRSDLAAHMMSPSTVDVHVISSVSAREITLNDDGAAQGATKAKRNSRLHEDIVEEDARDVVSIAASTSTQSAATADDRPETPRSPKASVASTTAPSETSAGAASSAPTNGADEEGGNTLSTPIAAAAADADSPGARLPRSQSADVTASARLSRALTASSSALGSATASASASHTEDDASTHTSSDKAARPRPRPKRSQSADPNRTRSLLKKFKSHPNAQTASSSSSTAGAASQAPTPGGTLSQRKVQVGDFEMMRVLGKGCAGKVLLVRYKSSADLYALKAITKRHVLAHQELQHTLTEQAVLKRMAAEGTDPFVVKLWWSFHDKENLFLVMDFHPGGDLATQLARWGRLGRDRARFYAAEIVEGVEGLHAAGVIYRDLKPENILIAADGHIVLTDFGLSKEFPRRAGALALAAPSTPGGRSSTNGNGNGAANGFATPPGTPYWMANGGNGGSGGSGVGSESPQDLAGWPARATDSTSTFCGTAEYLAPEVIQGLPYSYEVDWWSFGTMLYEMLTGITPFWADNHSDMYVRVLQDELQFPDDRAMDQDTKSLIRGLLQRNPALRLSEPRIKRHPYFSMIDWSHVYHKRYIPPYIPPIDPSNASDTQNFDDTFLDMEPVINDENDLADTDAEREQTDTDRTDGEDSLTTPSQSRSSSVQPVEDASVDVFDGYSFKGRHSVILDEEEDEDEDEGGDEEEEEEEVEVEGDDDSGMTPSILAEVNGSAEPSELGDDAVAAAKEETPEPKTPEARPTGLPAIPAPESVPAHPGRVSSETTRGPVRPVPHTLDNPPRTPQSPTKALAPEPARAEPPRKEPSKPKDKKGGAPPSKPAPARASAARTGRRREKSGIPALDRDLSDAAEEDEAGTERDEDEDDWDFIEADGGEDRNGAKATSLFARGVVDRYKLAVFRKGATPNRAVSGVSGVSGVSSQASASDAQGSEYSKSPSPQEKQRRGRAPGLTFRRTPKPFLGGVKSPPAGTKTLSHSTSATLSASASTGTGASLHPSSQSRGTLAVSPSLKSKESAVSIGSPHSSSDTSMNDDGVAVEGDVAEAMRVHSAAGADESSEKQQQQQQPKNKKLKKYKEGAEKVLSLFASPR